MHHIIVKHSLESQRDSLRSSSFFPNSFLLSLSVLLENQIGISLLLP